MNNNHHHHHHKALPKRIILIRHGESQGNLDNSAYTTTPDHRIPLTHQGILQSRQAGQKIVSLMSSDSSNDYKVYFYVSPYERTRSTLREIGKAFSKKRVIGVREECRIREQDFGNFQVEERMRVIKKTRQRFGRFYYRFPEGESAADVYDRVSTSRVFLMKWFKWTVEQFEYLNNFGHCEYRVMQLGDGGEYSFAINHSEEEMQEWGLSPEMIADQKWRAHAKKGEWNEKCSWYLDAFFDGFADSDDDCQDSDDPSIYDDCRDSSDITD